MALRLLFAAVFTILAIYFVWFFFETQNPFWILAAIFAVVVIISELGGQ